MTTLYLIELEDTMDGYYHAWHFMAICDSEERADQWMEDYANAEYAHVIDSKKFYEENVRVCLEPEYPLEEIRVRKVELLQ